METGLSKLATRRVGLTATVAVGIILAGCAAPTDDILDSDALALTDGAATDILFPRYHYAATFNEDLAALEAAHPDLVDVLVVGSSVMGRPIYLATVTNEAKRAEGPRPIAFIDGCHHGNEIQGCEAPLFLAYFLANNYATNASVRFILDSFEVHVLPTVNPDGRDLMTRVNANGINLNRNYPTDHGNPLGLSYPLGPPITTHTWRLPSPWVPSPAAELIPGAVPFQRPVRPSENGGWAALDQPETRAVNNWLALIQDDLAVYITFHTATHSIVVPWAAMQEPREMPGEHVALFDETLAWINGHMTYKGGRIGWGDSSGNLSYAASGSSMDWAYEAYEVPSFTVETFVPAGVRDQWPDDVNFWGASAMVFPLKILMNVDKLGEWTSPAREFPYPSAWTNIHYFPEGPGNDVARDAPDAAWYPEL